MILIDDIVPIGDCLSGIILEQSTLADRRSLFCGRLLSSGAGAGAGAGASFFSSRAGGGGGVGGETLGAGAGVCLANTRFD